MTVNGDGSARKAFVVYFDDSRLIDQELLTYELTLTLLTRSNT